MAHTCKELHTLARSLDCVESTLRALSDHVVRLTSRLQMVELKLESLVAVDFRAENGLEPMSSRSNSASLALTSSQVEDNDDECAEITSNTPKPANPSQMMEAPSGTQDNEEMDESRATTIEDDKRSMASNETSESSGDEKENSQSVDAPEYPQSPPVTNNAVRNVTISPNRIHNPQAAFSLRKARFKPVMPSSHWVPAFGTSNVSRASNNDSVQGNDDEDAAASEEEGARSFEDQEVSSDDGSESSEAAQSDISHESRESRGIKPNESQDMEVVIADNHDADTDEVPDAQQPSTVSGSTVPTQLKLTDSNASSELRHEETPSADVQQRDMEIDDTEPQSPLLKQSDTF